MAYLIFDGTAAEAIAFFWGHRAAGQAYGSCWKSPRRGDHDRGLDYSCRGSGALAHCEEPPDTWWRIVIRSPLRRRCGRGDRARCFVRKAKQRHACKELFLVGHLDKESGASPQAVVN